MSRRCEHVLSITRVSWEYFFHSVDITQPGSAPAGTEGTCEDRVPITKRGHLAVLQLNSGRNFA